MSINKNQLDLSLGIEIGSTRIKLVLINIDKEVIANGEAEWENNYINDLWTYDLELMWLKLQLAYRNLVEMYEEKYGKTLSQIGSIGISAMMHGYLPFNDKDENISMFRTWRNTNTAVAAEELSQVFSYNIPLRWSIAHLYQAMMDHEKHLQNISYLTTLSGYVHWKLTGKKVIGIGDASGMFPIDSKMNNFNSEMCDKFNDIIHNYGHAFDIKDILPKVLLAGERAGNLTQDGAKLLDPSGSLNVGIPFCPPEGDAGTGMVATNSIKPHTGNVSAGTSIFSMVVLEEQLSNYYKEVDIVSTPSGQDVAMIHCNNFTSDINAWINLFNEVIESFGLTVDKNKLFNTLFEKSIEADEDSGGLANCCYYSGEPITDVAGGRPLFARMPDSIFNLPNFMQSIIYSSLVTLRVGMDILKEKEQVSIDYLLGHGGFFKTENVSQQIMANALQTDIYLNKQAEEGGAWGMALLAHYLIHKSESSLSAFLDTNVFKENDKVKKSPSLSGVKSFELFMEKHQALIKVEKQAIESLI